MTGVAPKVKDNEVGSIKKVAPSNEIAPLICAAQGYPTPKFRYLIIFLNKNRGAWTCFVLFNFFFITTLLLLLFSYFLIYVPIPEPTNNIPPKAMDKKYGFSIIFTNVNDTTYLLCQVVGYPVPLFR